ncbi:MAG: DEAD/DEAH box helicase, partial [Treponema sp.]|nr:DEAD/DEAH box helicase [Treponema sp.]
MARFFDLVFDIPANQRFSYRMDDKALAGPGKRAMAPFGRRETLGYIVASREEAPSGLDPEGIKALRRVVDPEPVFDERDIALAEWLSAYYLCGMGQALAAMIPSGRRLLSYPSLPDEEDDIAALPHELSDEQQRALDALSALPFPAGPGGGVTGTPPMFYLYGITGSGKTEVFLRAAEHTIGAGRSVIYLVPEISLTHQTAEAIGKRFGKAAATLHSGMSPGARFAEWMRIRRGEVRIVVGPRSAVFAPVKDLGLVVIDEEHDGSYKSGNTPRYHARQAAMRR